MVGRRSEAPRSRLTRPVSRCEGAMKPEWTGPLGLDGLDYPLDSSVQRSGCQAGASAASRQTAGRSACCTCATDAAKQAWAHRKARIRIDTWATSSWSSSTQRGNHLTACAVVWYC
jgi:hypothetical protein